MFVLVVVVVVLAPVSMVLPVVVVVVLDESVFVDVVSEVLLQANNRVAAHAKRNVCFMFIALG